MASEMCIDKENVISIPEYFDGQSIFVTGGTGFMGKVLIEKILRSCPGVDKIYVLIRPKRGMPIEERWSNIIQLPLFEKLNRERPEALKKIVLIPGNITDEDMSISTQHIKILQENVSIIYHMAALNSTDSVREALIQNVSGTLGMLELSRTIKNLKVFVHMSTAYCNFNMPCANATEKVHPCCQDWKVLMHLLKTEPNTLESLREKLLCGHPNPYTWSKSISEQIVNEYRQFFPVIIIRPGMVGATKEDPIPAWNDGTNACFTMTSLVFLGILRVGKWAADDNQDIIPVDTAIKACLITPWKLHITGPQTKTDVYTCTTASEEVITYEDMESVMPQLLRDFPSKDILLPPYCFHLPNSFLHYILFFILQLVPGAILDAVLLVRRKKTMFTSLNKKIINGYRLSQSIIAHKVIFPNQRFKELTKFLKEKDVKDFGFITKYSGEEKKKLMIRQVVGFFKFYIKEDMCEENIKKNRERYERIKKVYDMLMNAGRFVFAYYLLTGVKCVIVFCSNSVPSILSKFELMMNPLQGISYIKNIY